MNEISKDLLEGFKSGFQNGWNLFWSPFSGFITVFRQQLQARQRHR